MRDAVARTLSKIIGVCAQLSFPVGSSGGRAPTLIPDPRTDPLVPRTQFPISVTLEHRKPQVTVIIVKRPCICGKSCPPR